MEEAVGKLWHRLVTRGARRGYPEAAVSLEEVKRAAGVVFRALGGDQGLSLRAAALESHGARLSLLQRFAGSGRRSELASLDHRFLRLPACVDCFPERELNRELYLWLAALAATGSVGPQRWFADNQAITLRALRRYPGLRGRYRRLVQAHLGQRPDPQRLAPAEARQERAIRRALLEPGVEEAWLPARRPPLPVVLWLYPAPDLPEAERPGVDPEPPAEGGGSRVGDEGRRRRAERVSMPEGKDGFMFNRMETILSWAEYIRVNRATEDDDNDAQQAAEDLDRLSLARDRSASATRVRFDLDLPPEADDDRPLGEGILLPEWDWQTARMQPHHCRLQPMVADRAPAAELPGRLRRPARRLRAQLEHLRPDRLWLRRQPEGSELDMDACLEHAVDRRLGRTDTERGLFRDLRNHSRDLACLLLADLSLSTDAWINNDARVIDVIRDGLYLFAEALAATGDRFGIYGFSSRRREYVRFHLIKDFAERYDRAVRGRIEAIRPGYYTRMGAAVRQATAVLSEQAATRRLLLIVSDGKPNDLDRYDGRYGVEDTRKAVQQAREAGLQPFCVTIDHAAGDYLPHLFGSDGYVVIRRAADLPRRLPLLYAQLTR